MNRRNNGRRAYGTGSVYLKGGVWMGAWRAGGRRTKRSLGPIKSAARPDGLTKKHAERRLRELRERVSSGEVFGPRPTFAQVAERHVARLDALGRKRSTIEDYRGYLRTHLVPAFGDTPVADLTRENIERFMLQKLREGSAAKSVRNWLGLLHGILAYAEREGHIPANPAKHVAKPQVVESDPDLKFLNLEELDKLLEAVPGDDLGQMERTLYLAAAMTGLRQGEALALRWRDIDWVASRIRVRRAYVRGEFNSPKSARSSRSVPLADKVARELERHFQRSAYQGDGDLVFSHPHTGRPYDRSKLLKRFKKARDRAKVTPVTFHGLRHTFGTRMAAAGVPMRTIQEWMGHRDFATTLKYAHYAPGHREAEYVERAFAGEGDNQGANLQSPPVVSGTE
jgi:integrase